MSKREKKDPSINDLIAAIERLEGKVEACNGLCESILDEVVPIGLALDALSDVQMVE